MKNMAIEVLRAESEWQRAGAYSVRIQGMNRQHHIPLREEFDEHDGDGTRYIVLLDDGYPVATCRFYELGVESMVLGRVVVLPEYRGSGLGRSAVCRCAAPVDPCGSAAGDRSRSLLHLSDRSPCLSRCGHGTGGQGWGSADPV